MSENELTPSVGVTLSIRQNEKRIYLLRMPKSAPSLFAVALVDAQFPHEMIEPSCSYMVACAEYSVWKSGAGWGWTSLEPDTKNVIGHDLIALDAKPGQWIYLILEQAKPVIPESENVPEVIE